MFALSIGVKLGGDADEGLAGRSGIHPTEPFPTGIANGKYGA
jgi:hypothetical protein